jgi:hypothetical protein
VWQPLRGWYDGRRPEFSAACLTAELVPVVTAAVVPVFTAAVFVVIGRPEVG